MPMTIAEPLATVPDALRPWVAGVRTISFAEPPEGTFVQLPDALTKVVLRVTADGQRDVLAVGPRVCGPPTTRGSRTSRAWSWSSLRAPPAPCWGCRPPGWSAGWCRWSPARRGGPPVRT
ncbi:hypothetical protein ACIRBZ_16675 [Streptomyces sp. NPDC094038]|uniref:hypothetical protein n=1 Tax=Streptomyces sp. NPDC094038 TaxID=3366055 RepID=UPI0038219338